MRTPKLPVGYAKALKKLESMTETTGTYDEYAKIANRVIKKLKRIQLTGGKAKADIKDIVTKSTVDSILFGLGDKYPDITKQLESLSKSAFTWQDLVKIHGKRIDMRNWTDTSLTEQLNEGSSSGGINSPSYGQNSGKSSGKSSGTSSSPGATPAGTTPSGGSVGSVGPKSQSFKESIPGAEETGYNLGKYKSDNVKFGADHMAKKMSRSQLKEMLRNEILSKKQENLSEGWKDLAAAAAIGLGSMTGVSADDKSSDVKITQTAVKNVGSSLLNKKTSDYISHWEGSKDVVYNDIEGKPTIGIGHYLNNSQEDRKLFKTLFGDIVNYDKILNGQQKLSTDQIEKLFNVDVKIKEKLASNKISNFNTLPISVKNAIINALYRGDLGPKTIAFMNSGKWDSAAKEYLNHKNAKSGPEQIKKRMNTNALAFVQFAKNKG